jgi:hypothetical protein
MVTTVTSPSDVEILAALDSVNDLIRMDKRRHRYEILRYVPGEGNVWEVAPSVTQVIDALNKPALIPWAAKVQQEADIAVAWRAAQDASERAETFAERFTDADSFEARFRELAGQEKEHRKQLKAAEELGTQVHALIEHHLKGLLGIDVPAPEVSDEAHFCYSDFERWAKDAQLRPVALERIVVSHRHGFCGTLDFIGWCEGHLEVLDWKTSNGIYPEMRLQSVAYRKAVEEMGLPLPGGRLIRLPKDKAEPPEVYVVKDDPDAAFGAFLGLLAAHRWLKTAKKEAAV